MIGWEQEILNGVPHTEREVAEVGARAVVGLRRENFGLQRQRIAAITARQPRDQGWRMHFGPDGLAPSMSWAGVRGAEV